MTPAQLKAYRSKYGLTQEKLAELLGVKRNTVNRWEMGTAPILKMTELALKELSRSLKR